MKWRIAHKSDGISLAMPERQKTKQVLGCLSYAERAALNERVQAPQTLLLDSGLCLGVGFVVEFRGWIRGSV